MADTDQSPAERLKIFISYARADSAALAEELVTGLELAGFEPYLDRHDIAAAEDWEARLGALIQSADTVVFIISPAAVKSERCAWEVELRRQARQAADPDPTDLDPGSARARSRRAGAAAAPELHFLQRRPVLPQAAHRIGDGAAAGCRMDSRAHAAERDRRPLAGQKPGGRRRRRSAAARRRPDRRHGLGRPAEGERAGDHGAAAIVSCRERILCGIACGSGAKAARRARAPDRRNGGRAASSPAFPAAHVRSAGGVAALVVLGTGAGLWSVFTSWQRADDRPLTVHRGDGRQEG